MDDIGIGKPFITLKVGICRGAQKRVKNTWVAGNLKNYMICKI